MHKCAYGAGVEMATERFCDSSNELHIAFNQRFRHLRSVIIRQWREVF
jgi:hypothetical protein